MKKTALLLTLTLLSLGAYAQEAPKGDQSTAKDIFATKSYFATGRFERNSNAPLIGMGKFAEGKGWLDLGNLDKGKALSGQYPSFQAYLEDAHKHGLEPISIMLDTDNVDSYVVFKNTKAE